ncbi:MAG: GNAT family N-acetyltransferase [Deltaproteobacteria bacterium]|nr:GNAT family N-acetyltransferase [Deltaproteobacteria bacterium]MBW2071561.1 GNAT family N-acetyltransferase [Deltaproteobacteria bacterium]
MILHDYPKVVNLRDGTSITIRPLRKDDEEALYDYFNRLPPEDRLRLKDDVTDRKVIENWILDLDYDSVLPLLALHNDRIIANATLHFSPIGWTKHQAEIRITSDPEYRKKGLATILIENLIDIAIDLGLEQLTAEIVPELDKARVLFEKLGFRQAGVLKGFIKDIQGNYADLVLMVRDIRW